MNWGYRIMVAFLLGVAFIMFFVISSMRMNTEMVEADYYTKELNFESQMRATSNLTERQGDVRITVDDAKVNLLLDAALSRNMQRGSIFFYCPAAEGADKKFELKASETGSYSFDRALLKGS